MVRLHLPWDNVCGCDTSHSAQKVGDNVCTLGQVPTLLDKSRNILRKMVSLTDVVMVCESRDVRPPFEVVCGDLQSPKQYTVANNLLFVRYACCASSQSVGLTSFETRPMGWACGETTSRSSLVESLVDFFSIVGKRTRLVTMQSPR